MAGIMLTNYLSLEITASNFIGSKFAALWL